MATYENMRLDVYVHDCFPKDWPWAKFFIRPDVQKAITSVANKLALEAKTSHIDPPIKNVFKALEMVDPNNIKVVIVGQDPTPQEGESTGMAFSVDNPKRVPSVMNVLMEVALEGWSVNLNNGDLSKWAKQGVLLLNSALTIGIRKVKGKKNTKRKLLVDHLNYWSLFTSLVIKSVPSPSVWILWGKLAQTIAIAHIPEHQNHYIIKGTHPSPSPFTGEFFGRNYFFCANQFLKEKYGQHAQIDWGLAVEKDERLSVRSTGFDLCPAF